MVFEAVEQSVDKGFVFEELVPAFIGQVGCDDRGFSAVAHFHELEECIGLFRLE